MPSKPGWVRIGRYDSAARRAIWARENGDGYDLCAGREGDDESAEVKPGPIADVISSQMWALSMGEPSDERDHCIAEAARKYVARVRELEDEMDTKLEPDGCSPEWTELAVAVEAPSAPASRDDAERVCELEAIIEALFQVTPWIRPSTTEAGVALQRSIAVEQIGDQCSPALDAMLGGPTEIPDPAPPPFLLLKRVAFALPYSKSGRAIAVFQSP